ncbi:MAG: hypothetical protein E7252_09290 [Lachnospira sp.]|nr:hypothetical protein [Lachnospira sp.]
MEYKDNNNMFARSLSRRNRSDRSFQTAPLRIYNEDVVDYYKMALSSKDPYIKYISFYHILEYYYDEVFKTKLIADLKNKITHPSFSYKDNDKLYDLASFIKNRWKANSEDGQGNELESLKYVLEEYIDITELQTRIEAYDNSSISYYANNKVPFSNAPVIHFSDATGIITSLSKRIYFTRNALVHSKSSRDNKRYKPYKNEVELNKEIPLIQAIAELVIINSSSNL